MNILVACQCKKACIGGVGEHLPVHIINKAGEQVLAQPHLLSQYGIQYLHYVEVDPACPEAVGQYKSWDDIPNGLYDMIVLMGCPIYAPLWGTHKREIENKAAADGAVFHSIFDIGWDKLRVGGMLVFHPLNPAVFGKDTPSPEGQARIFREVVIPLFTAKPWMVAVGELGALPVVIADESHTEVAPYNPHTKVIGCMKREMIVRRASRKQRGKSRRARRGKN